MNKGGAAGPRPRPVPHLAQCEPPQWPRAGTHLGGPPARRERERWCAARPTARPAAPHRIRVGDAHSPNTNLSLNLSSRNFRSLQMRTD
eukprot:363841-Chlamydomonas_euryale.AAC.11